jgi:hypothetical protein
MLSLRPALHDLADRPAGYGELSQIEVGAANLRFWLRDHTLRLEELSVVRVMSINPVSRFEKTPSWMIRAGGWRVRDAGCADADCFGGGLALGGGGAVAFAERRVAIWVMGEGDAMAAPALKGIAKSALRLGVGPSGGLRVQVDGSLTLLATASWLLLPGQEPSATFQADLGARWACSRNVGLGLEGRAQPASSELGLQGYFYF